MLPSSAAMLKTLRNIVLVVILVVFLAFLPFLLAGLFGSADGGEKQANLPWQIETAADGGSRVFGLNLGGSDTLADARARFGRDNEIAIVAPPGESPLLEVYFESLRFDYITGRLIVTAVRDDALLAAMQERAAKAEYMGSTTRKYTLNADDLPAAWAMPIDTITFIPSANLDEATVLQRFGEPARRIRTSEEVEHFLYPAQGLDLALDARKKEVLQYVAPRDFARLLTPLLAAAENAAPADGR